MKPLLIIILALSTFGCTVKAIKGQEVLILKGFGAKSAEFSDGSKIEKSEPFSVPKSIGGK